ncbi:hypothetical protein AH02_21 [Pseudomonas phage AH02]|nr:hypothetical protein AH02_21 [Pseudomonas phage AH02]
MAMTQADRDKKAAAKRAKAGEEELRMRVRPGTKTALKELMEWAGIEEQGEALTLMIHNLHGMGLNALPMLSAPRHVFEVSENVAREFHNKSLLMIQADPGDEVLRPALEVLK